jgi:hypothetical protein
MQCQLFQKGKRTVKRLKSDTTAFPMTFSVTDTEEVRVKQMAYDARLTASEWFRRLVAREWKRLHPKDD